MKQEPEPESEEEANYEEDENRTGNQSENSEEETIAYQNISMNTFFKKQDNLKRQPEKAFITANINEDEEEVFLLQCPKSIDKSNLIGLNIRKKPYWNRNMLETVTTIFNDSKTSIPVILKSKKTTKGVNVKIVGTIQVKEHISRIENIVKEEEPLTPQLQKVPFPENIKQRHPLLGSDYEKRLKIPDVILEQLKDAIQFRQHARTLEVKKEIETFDEFQPPVESKKSKKRAAIKDAPEIPPSPKKKKKAVIQEEEYMDDDEDLREDLSWIDNL